MMSSFNHIRIKSVSITLLLVFTMVPPIARSEDAPSEKPKTEDAKLSEKSKSEDSKTLENRKTGDIKDAAPKPEITCIFVYGSESSFKKSEQKVKEIDLGKGNTEKPLRTECNGRSFSKTTLIGAGDVGVVISKGDYDKVLKQRHDQNMSLMLYVNGVPMGSDAKLFSVQERNGAVELLWTIKPGKNSDDLWALLYRNGGLTTAQDLRLALGWGDGTVGPYYGNPDQWKIQITDALRRSFALTFVVLLVLLFIWMAWKTDALRDSPLPSWWQDAESLRKRLVKTPEQTDSILKRTFNFSAAPTDEDKERYKSAAQVVLKRNPIPENIKPEEIGIGLSLLAERWEPIPAAFSLARVQLGVWFLFAVATGVFLWVVYGELPALAGSILVLLGISVATTGMSFAVDRDRGASRPYTPTRGFLWDITTGFDEKQQIHRYQAVVVNGLLLLVGISHVLKQLTYPVFHESWLLFLGISGVTAAAGKAFVENKNL